MNYQKIIQIAESKNLNINQLAEKVGLTREGLAKGIRNESIKVETLEKIAEALDVPIISFFASEGYHSVRLADFQKLVKVLAEVHIYLKFNIEVNDKLSNLLMDTLILLARSANAKDSMSPVIDDISEFRSVLKEHDLVDLVETCYKELVKYEYLINDKSE